MSIAYTYNIVSVDEAARCMEVVYSANGYPTMHVGARLPYQHENLEDIIQMYAPVRHWSDQNAQFKVPTVGTVGQVTPPEPPQATLESTKLEKLAAIAVWRYLREIRGVSFNGSLIKTDREAQAAISNAYVSLKDGLVTSVEWKTATGDFMTLGLSDMANLAQIVALHIQDCFAKERTLVQQVSEATTIEAVHAVNPSVSYPEAVGTIQVTSL